ncbi:MAG: hypothetical protein P8X57_16350 [Cyclobacteriaceae bacterium]
MDYYTDAEWLTWIDELSGKDFVAIDDFLPPSVIEDLLSFFRDHLRNNDFAKAGIGAADERQIVSSIRGDHIYWISKERDEKLKPVFKLLDELITVLNRYWIVGTQDFASGCGALMYTIYAGLCSINTSSIKIKADNFLEARYEQPISLSFDFNISSITSIRKQIALFIGYS